MPRILLHSATAAEIEPALQFLQAYQGNKPDSFRMKSLELELCISGAGMVAAAFELGRYNLQSFDLAIQAGIAGSFGKFPVGSLVRVELDCFSELGAEDGENFLSMDDIGFGKQNQNLLYPYSHTYLESIPKARAITVNTVHGNESSIQKTVHRYTPDLESMEGAAFVYAANRSGWPAVQLRAISNLVERRNRDNWDIPKAVDKLNTFLIQFLKELDEN